MEQTIVENSTSTIEKEIMELVNDYRVSQGLNSVQFDLDTYNFAYDHNAYMISEGQISHDNFDKRSSYLAKEVNTGFVSENVGRNFITARALVEAWKNSPTHKKVMLGDFTHAAVSATADSAGIFYFTHLFYK